MLSLKYYVNIVIQNVNRQINSYDNGTNAKLWKILDDYRNRIIFFRKKHLVIHEIT